MSTLPIYVRALLEMLRGGGPSPLLDEEAWHELLRFADRTQGTLFLQGAPGLPAWFASEIESRLAKNAVRRARLLAAFEEAAAALGRRGIEFVLLKGFTHENAFGIDGAMRVQYDLDFLLLPADAGRARSALGELGYAPHGTAELSELHERPLVKPFAWRWRGDYFDPEMPIAIELHTKLWSAALDRIEVPGLDAFWDRRAPFEQPPERAWALAEPDRVAFAALHCLRHILHNEARPAHLCELARFLDRRAADARFWSTWRHLYSARLRELQSLAFRFAAEWFGCRVPTAVEEEWRQLAPSVRGWFERFAYSPLANLVVPNKDVLWLHLELVERHRDRLAVFLRRLLPVHAPDRTEAAGSSYAAHVLKRIRYHARALAPALWTGVRWRRTASSRAPETSAWNRPRV
jgi:hypothetical protein